MPVRGQRLEPKPALNQGGNFDARPHAPTTGLAAQPAPRAAVSSLSRLVPDAAATLDETTGVTRTLVNQLGYLSQEDPAEPRDIAQQWVRANADVLGLQASDLGEYLVTDIVRNAATGSTHVYLLQTWQTLPVYNAQLQININRDGRILSVNNAFVPDLPNSANLLAPALPASDAVVRAAASITRPVRSAPRTLARQLDVSQETTLDPRGISREPLTARLMWLPIQRGAVRLVWNFQVHTLEGDHAYDFTVDAESGDVWTRFDWVAPQQYSVYQLPVESPNHTSPLPPADGRTIQVNPANALASPYGWHDVNGAAGPDYTITRGNNAHAYEDTNNDGLPPAPEVDCGPSLLCSFGLNLAGPPAGYIAAAVTNLFYWNNVNHDVHYQYGFTELAGNFQVNNYGRGGLGNDDVRAEALDGGGTNNANMFTPPDGQRPRMQMYVWTSADPDRTSDFDTGVITHEYGHGVSNRLVGGPSNVSCLSNPQQPGEGLSDWWALALSARPGDTGAMGRGMATYLQNQPITGTGIRGQRYSTDQTVNTWTYESINGAAIPHGVGSVWAQAAWEMYWALVTRYGFDPNLYNAAGGAGNQRALLYVTEGLMNTPCSPSFTEVRDGILQAAIDNYGGQDLCLLWDGFARFGLGANAASGGPYSTAPTNGFSLPTFCLTAPPPTIAITDVAVPEAAGTGTFTATINGARPYAVQVRYATADYTAKASTASATYSNAAAISIPTVGTAAPYPSTISVPSAPGVVTGITVTLHGFSHTYLYELNMLLVGPGGQKVMLMSTVPVFGGYSGSLTFSDAGAPIATGLSTGLVRPSGPGTYTYLPSPAPTEPFAGSLSTFAGTNPVGVWSLYIYDWATGDSGAVSGGWSITLNTGDYVPRSGLITFAPGATSVPVTVPIVNDATGEPLETFFINLSNPENSVLGDAQGVASIADDDGGPPPGPVNPLGDVAVDFGGAGLWMLYNRTGSPQWTQIHGANPGLIATANLDGNASADLAVVFPGHGLYARMNNTNWVPLHPVAPSEIEVGDLDGNGIDEIIASFTGYGIWVWINNAAWVNLHAVNPVSMSTGNIDGDPGNRTDLILSFPGVGTWTWMNNALWSRIHQFSPANLQSADIDGNGKADVVGDFTGLGIWTWLNNTRWTPLMGSASAGIVLADIDGDVLGRSDVVINFAGFGVWAWMNNNGWVQLHTSNSSMLAVGDLDANGRADVLMSFAGYGLFAFMNGTGYAHVHAAVAEAAAVGRFDGN